MSIKKFVIGNEIGFQGFVVKSENDKVMVYPDPDKIEAILSLATPVDKKGVREFAGLARQLEAWTPKFSLATKLTGEIAKNHVHPS